MNLKKSIVPLVFLFLFVTMVQAPVTPLANQVISEEMQISDDYIIREEITASSNAELLSLGFPGAGTVGDPIRIEGYEVPRIYLFRTDLYVDIINCKFANFRTHYSNNSRIERCEVTDYITFRYSTNNIVSNNNVSDGYILFDLTDTSTITNNILGRSGLIVRGDKAKHWQHTVLNNTAEGAPVAYVNSAQDLILDPDDYGVLILSESNNCTITNGTAGEDANQVYLGACSNCTITKNINYNFIVQVSNNISITENQGSTRYASGVDVLASSNVSVVNNTFWDNEKDGVALQRSENCIVENNTITGYTGLHLSGQTTGYGCYEESGINLYQADYCTIRNNTLAGNPRAGLWYYGNNYCDITENSLYDNTLAGIDGYGSKAQFSNNVIFDNHGPGITFYSADYHNITNNVFYNNAKGIDIQGHCFNATIANNTITDENACINLGECADAQIINNTMFGGGFSIDIDSYDPRPEYYDAEIVFNTINGKSLGYWSEIDSQSIDATTFGQILIFFSKNVTIYNGNLGGCITSIQVAFSNTTIIENATIVDCSRYGISFTLSQDIEVRNSTMINCTYGGQTFRSSTNISISNCTFEGGSYGATFSEGVEIQIQNCTFSNEVDGLFFNRCQNCSILNNVFNDCCIDFSGSWYNHFNHTIQDNLVNEKPLGYFSELSHSTIDISEFGAVIITNSEFSHFENGHYENVSSGVMMYYCFNCTVKGVTSRFNSKAGVKMATCYNCTVEDCVLSDNGKYGVELGNTWSGTRDNRIIGCTIQGNGGGVRLTYDRGTVITDSVISNNIDIGVEFYYAGNVTILRCNITNNEDIGIAMGLGNGCNTICYNNVSNNVRWGILDGTGGSFICNNTVSDNNGDGIYFSSGTTITGNQVYRNNGSGLRSGSGQYVNISWNWICNNSGYGIKINYDYDQTYNHDYFIIGNSLGNNSLGNALDNGINNAWDDGFIGNAWLDWSGEGVYLVPGLAGSIDNHPWLFGGEPPERPPIITTSTTTPFSATITSTPTSGTTTGGPNLLVGVTIIGSSVVIIGAIIAFIVAKKKQKS